MMDYYSFNINTNTNHFHIAFTITYEGIYDGIDGKQKYDSKIFKIKKEKDNIITLDDFPSNAKMDKYDTLLVCLGNIIEGSVYHYQFRASQLKSENNLNIVKRKNKYPILQLNGEYPYNRYLWTSPICSIL